MISNASEVIGYIFNISPSKEDKKVISNNLIETNSPETDGRLMSETVFGYKKTCKHEFAGFF